MPPVYRVDVGGDLNGKESILEEPQDSKVCVQLLRRTALAVFKQSLAHPFQGILKVHYVNDTTTATESQTFSIVRLNHAREMVRRQRLWKTVPFA